MRIYVASDQFDDLLMGHVRNNDLPIHLEKNRWTFVDRIEDADIIPIVRPPVYGRFKSYSLDEQLNFLRPHINNKWLLMLMHTHITETTNQETVNMFANEYGTDKIIITTANSAPTKNHIYCNHNFNWVKAYFTQYTKFDLSGWRLWTLNCSRASFKMNQLKLYDEGCQKKFLSPNIIRKKDDQQGAEFKNYARIELGKLIDSNQSFYSSVEQNVWLLPEEEKIFKTYDTVNGAVGIIPIANKYYDNSIVSVYVETIGGYVDKKLPVKAITEKTYIPLLKGHFILPFSYSGIIEDLKKQGFQFPEWIDYSYDKIIDDEKRLRAFLQSYIKLKKTPLKKLVELANIDFEIRKNNKQIIVRKPFDSLYEKIKVYTGL